MTTKQKFEKFHAQNPNIYMLFKEQVFRAIRRKRQKISSKAIINWIRWEVSIDTISDDGFKINDIYTPYYSRLFITDHPEYEYLFNFRKIRDGSEEHRPGEPDTQIINTLTEMKNGAQIIYHNDVHHCALYGVNSAPKIISQHMFARIKNMGLISENNNIGWQTHYKISNAGKKYISGISP